MNDGSLHVMAIVDEAPTMQLMTTVFEDAGDDIVIATDLAEGLARAAAEAPEVVFIDVSLGNGAGLALVHHLRAITPKVSVFALAHGDSQELGSTVMALGGAGVLTLPLTGDELLTAVGEVRRRRAEAEARLLLEREARAVELGSTLVARAADVADAGSRAEAAERLAEIFEEATGASRTLVYVPAGDRTSQLMRTAARGEVGQAPTFCEEMAVHNYARGSRCEVIPLTLKKKSSGLVVVGGHRDPIGGASMMGLLASQAATTLALVQEREQSLRGSMKDPSSSAYTFAYFVDVAGREIDKARRHGRRFALATIVFDSDAQRADSRVLDADWDLGSDAGTVQMAERLLGAVRDTDVLARVDDDEFYLLLPETGGAGAQTLRRRVMRRAAAGTDGRRTSGRAGLDLTMGCATYPHDGTDLSRLLRVAKHRVEAIQRSVVRRFGLDEQPLSEILDVLLLRAGDIEHDATDLEAPRRIELPGMDFLGVASSAVADAVRSGDTLVVATDRAGSMSVGSAARTVAGADDTGVRLRTVDVSDVQGCRDVEAMTVVCEHGVYVLLGKIDGTMVRAVHAADPLLADLVTQRLGEASGERLID